MTSGQRRASPVFAAIGIVAVAFTVLLLLAQLASIHPALAVAVLVLGPVLVGWATLRRIRNARPGERILPSPAKTYVELSQAGRGATRELFRIAQIVVVVLGWAVVAVIAVVVVALPMAILGIDNPIARIFAWLIVPAFLGCLVVGPLWTLRRLRR